MKKITGTLAIAAVAAMFLSSCAVGKKNDVAFGGGWSDPVSPAKTETVAKVAAVEVEMATPAEVVVENAPVATPAEATQTTTLNSSNSKTVVSEISTAAASQKNETVKTKKANKWLKKAIEKKMAKDGDNTLLYIIVAFFIPFLGVLLYEGSITNHFWISLLLTLLFWLPGFIYAVLVILGNI